MKYSEIRSLQGLDHIALPASSVTTQCLRKLRENLLRVGVRAWGCVLNRLVVNQYQGAVCAQRRKYDCLVLLIEALYRFNGQRVEKPSKDDYAEASSEQHLGELQTGDINDEESI